MICFGGLTRGNAGTPDAVRPPRYALAFHFIFNQGAEVYFCKESPFTLLLSQGFQGSVAEGQKPWEGLLQIIFNRNQLVLKGLDLREVSQQEIQRDGEESLSFQPMRFVSLLTGVDLYPVSRQVAIKGRACMEKGLNVKCHGEEHTVYVHFEMSGPIQTEGNRSRAALYLEGKDGHPSSECIGEVPLGGDYQAAPWLWNEDLNGDGCDEILFGYLSYGRREFFAMSATPDAFKGVREMEENFTNFRYLPDPKADIFKKGHEKTIPVKERGS
jgi:hypothetical protein